MSKQSFSEYLEKRQKALEEYLIKENAFDVPPKKYNPQILVIYEKLSMVYRLQGKDERYQMMLHQTVSFAGEYFSPQIPEGMKNAKEEPELISSLGHSQFILGIDFLLADEDHPKSRQLFEYTVKNCTLPEDYIKNQSYHNQMNTAFSYLWKGYALLNLGRYNEAYDCLVKVAPIYKNITKSGGEMWHTVEFALTKALVPLCEFKVNPTKENLKKARKGVEDYIKSLHDNKEKLDGYIYYFHLKEQFADIYTADPKKFPEAGLNKTDVKLKTPTVSLPDTTNDEGSVIIYDPGKSDAFGIIGSNRNFGIFVDYVTNLGGFPELAGLMDLYTLGQLQDAKPLINDCRKFLSTPGIDPVMLKIGKVICEAVQEAASKDSQIIIYYNPDLDPDSPG